MGRRSHTTSSVTPGVSGSCRRETGEPDILYEGLPCVWDGSRYVIFSPYALKVARIERHLLSLDGTRQHLGQLGFFGEPTTPSEPTDTAEVGLILTTHCNLRCSYCYVDREAEARWMTPRLAVRAVEQGLRQSRPRLSVSFFGGEPTLNMRAVKAAVEHVRASGVRHRFIINTNGTCSDDELQYMITNRFIFSVSSDGPPEITDRQRRRGRGRTVSRAIDRTARRLVASGCLTQVRATVTREGLPFLAEGIRYWASLGIRFVHFEPVGQFTCSGDAASCPGPDEYVDGVLDAIDEASRLGIWIISSPYMNLLTPSTYFCTTMGSDKQLHTPDGMISACYRAQSRRTRHGAFLYGAYVPQSGAFALHAERQAELRRISAHPRETCRSCHARFICAGGCPLRNLAETGDVLGVDEWSCRVKKQLIADAILRIACAAARDEQPVVVGQSVFEHLAAQEFRR